MNKKPWMFGLLASGLFTACQSNQSLDSVVSQTFVHKYGFDVSEQEWQERSQEGKVVTRLKNGVQITRSFENGQLHGHTTYSFPHSSIIEKTLTYDQGSLLKEVVNDSSGIPIQEEIYEFDNRKILTSWDEKGSPLSIEAFEGPLLMQGKYYNSDHELEGEVSGGYGEKICRDRSGLLVEKNQLREGVVYERTTYHPTGQPHTISHYEQGELHGEQRKFTSLGQPLMELEWKHGILDGKKIVYHNGVKVAEIPYVEGKKEGSEFHYDDLGNLTAEIQWRNDKKHGCSKFYTEELIEIEWFFKGQCVNADRYESLTEKETLF